MSELENKVLGLRRTSPEEYTAEMLERGAFACFPHTLEDAYKRTLLIVVAAIIMQQPNVSVNRCHHITRKVLGVTDDAFRSALNALNTPLNCIVENSYTRGTTGARKEVTHLNFETSGPWRKWFEAVSEKYPELMIWMERPYGTLV